MLHRIDKTNAVAIILLFVMGAAALLSMRSDSLTFDELAHIPAGYSYLTQQDYRLNPEHPPLFKDLAAAPLLFLDLTFPSDKELWLQTKEAPAWWVQFDLGREFLYRSGNDPKKIILFSRLSMIGFLLLLGWILFKTTRGLFGNRVALGSLFLFAFSPTLLAHGRLVTNDVAAALGAFGATFLWLEFLKHPTKTNIFKAGIIVGVAMILKFTLVLLIPFLAILTLFFVLLHKPGKAILKELGRYVVLGSLAGIIGVVFVIFPIYQFHVWNYPAEHQTRDTRADLSAGGLTTSEQIVISMTENPLLRPLAQYARGVFMVGQRVSFGNTVYFLGNISGSGFSSYFPTLYLFKEPLALHLLTLIAIAGLLFLIFRNAKRLFSWFRTHFAIVSSALFILLYWGFAMAGNLNIGIRHLLPTYPFLFLVIAWSIKETHAHIRYSFKKPLVFMVLLLGIWYAGSSIASFPGYLSYYNELAGGPAQGWRIAADSNYDWGQDFYRLLDFVEKNNIQKIKLDYFGGENPQYWLEDKYVKLDPKKVAEDLSKGLALSEAGGGVEGWIAVSVNQMVGGRATAVAGYDQPTDYYRWLDQYKPVARAGTSIFIYHLTP
ncbi:MAG: glycosyltransferase family 39 protein [Parcubacteria group bacterium]|nr:glycosyltransferase family 39 protein [Parcubacteria group bacterium]